MIKLEVRLAKQPLEKLLKPISKAGLIIAVIVPDIYEIRYKPVPKRVDGQRDHVDHQAESTSVPWLNFWVVPFRKGRRKKSSRE